ncbi:MAG: TonB-dependent receptor [Candidatus Eremiobacteraeota bacterium]|nr:TonB-dependent receptor [Candidatus Eremiobacteraeota bacterium]
MRKALFAVTIFALAAVPFGARAGTTGTLRGRIVDATTQAPIAGATVTAVSPSQTAQSTTDPSGSFSFISLQPDTYTISASKPGYDPQSQPGISVVADQSATVTLLLAKALKTIARTTSRSTQSLVRSGVTSDVYSVNPAGQKAASTLNGSGSLTQAYGAIASAPGVNIPSNQQGWYQSVYIRGGDVDQVAYEFDGLPTTRQSDLAPIATLTSLGSQEVQVYTGGTPATSNSSGLAGYINQVIKTGTFPGYATADFGIGGPAFYHQATVELGGATPDRLFSYYVGFSGTNQTFRYGSQFGGVSDPLYFYPLNVPSNNNVYNILDGSAGKAPNYGFIAQPGYSYAQAADFDRENVVNLHIGIPHRDSSLRDDVQMLYVTGGIAAQFYSSANDIWYTPEDGKKTGIGYPMPYLDSLYYGGPLMQAPRQQDVVAGLFPSSPSGRPPGSPIDLSNRDGNWNGYSIEKLQYQKNIDPHSYVRALVYGEYSTWFINGPNSAQLVFGSDPADYEVLEHGFGGSLIYANQLATQNLLTAEASYNTQRLQTYNAGFSSTDPSTTSLAATGLGTILSSYGTPNGVCYNYKTGQQWSCFDRGSQGGCLTRSGCYPGEGSYDFNLIPGYAPAGSPAAKAGARWMMTENGQSAQVDNVTPHFDSFALTDLWEPNDRLVVNAGARVDQFEYSTNNLENGYPARQFWFDAYNNEHCGAPASTPQWTWNPKTDSFNACSPGLSPLTAPGNGLYNVGAGTNVSNVFQPRVSFTYTLNPDTVIRGSAGKYARAEGSSYYQYNTYQQNLASFIAQFYPYGYHTPDHDIYPDTSDNFDLSLEKHVKGTQLSYKITPFYRDTSNQLQFQAINPVQGTLAGLNVGTQESYGAELSLQYGDFGRNGLSGLFSYTHTQNRIRFSQINGVSVIDALNAQVELYNSYTAACSGVTKSSANWQACGSGAYAGNAAALLPNNQAGTRNRGKLKIPNPYYGDALQPLFDPAAWYTPYDVIPSPFNAANGYEVPDVASLILNYRHNRFTLTPSLHYNDGSSYGSPLVWPGYVPQSCSAQPSKTPLTPGASCPGGAIGAVFLPDPYSGRFDNLGAFVQPAELSANLQTSYALNPRMTLTVQAVNLYNHCFQRGYAWDNSVTCVYSNLPSNILAPSGNFVKNPPVQVRYPYGTFYNITEVGISSVLQPFGFFADLSIRL